MMYSALASDFAMLSSIKSYKQRESVFPLLPNTALSIPGHTIDPYPSLGEGCVVKWRNSLTDCSLCLILQIRTNNRLNWPADLFLMTATHYLTFGCWFQMWSYWLVANTGLSLGLYNLLGLFSEMLPSFYITKGTFLIYHLSWVFSKFRPEKLFSKLTHCNTDIYPFINTVYQTQITRLLILGLTSFQ